VDFVAHSPIPERMEHPLRAALCGEVVAWPRPLTADETRAIVEHGLAPLLYRLTRLPELRNDALRAAILEPLRRDDAFEVFTALAANGIESLILKGGALAYQIYDDPELRPRGDCDLLIRPSSLGVARQAFQRLGFREIAHSGDEHGVRQSAFVRTTNGVQHAYDVHWAITNTPLFAHALEFEDLLRRCVEVPELGPDARALSRPDALLLACIHRVAHHHDSERLIWLVDIARLRERMEPEEHRAFWQLAAKAKVVAVCAHSIELANLWTSTPLHDRAEDWLSPEEIRAGEASRRYLDREIRRGGVLAAELQALPWRARLERLWQLAFPPVAFMRESFGVRSALLLPLLYPYRAIRGCLRLFRRARA
jgi:hypothetical protein